MATATLRFYRSYEEQAAAWDHEFGRVSAQFADRLQCRKGCSMCCSQMFSISALEAAVISRTVAAMPDDQRNRLRDAARRYVADARRLGVTGADNAVRPGTDTTLGTEADRGAHAVRRVDPDSGHETVTPRPGVRLTCPALEHDACSIYAARPLICRKWGIPVFDPSKPERLYGCALNFREGEALDADPDDLIEPQRVLLEQWAAIKDDIRETLNRPMRATTVAEAILHDATDFLA